MKSILGFIVGAVMGALVGGTLALLLTPASGDEVRQRIGDRVKYIQDEVRSASEMRRAELEKQIAELRSPRRPPAAP